ncbi:MAG: HAMP domain-containing histidine kinase [Ruminococcus sp.]|nr:HAMP domain-containing histidine kinase [Candidatus Apopatosoma intestinale]
MKNSIFTKYVSAFLIIIFISFTILVTVVSSMTIRTEGEQRRAVAKNTADYIREYADGEMREFYTPISFAQFVSLRYPDFSKMLDILSKNADGMQIFLLTADGNILLSTGKRFSGPIKDEKILEMLAEQKNAFSTGDMDGRLERISGLYYAPIFYPRTHEVAGGLLVSFSAGEADALTLRTVRTIVLVSLWIMIVSFVAIYFITERIVSPLKQMSRATKQFAEGRFDVRIPATGNDEIAELAVAFNKMAESLSNLEYMRSSFLANISHDLRTPMTTIAGFIDGILDGAIPPEKQDYYLGVIASEVRRLSRLVSSLLDISRIQAGDRKFEKHDFDICEMSRIILLSFEKQIDEKGLDIEFDAPDEVWAYSDKDAINQVLYNICDNAVKFSREGGKYRISIREDGEHVAVSVYNEGIGIAEDDLPYVFERFYKSDKSRGLDKTGVGLGLFISKTIVDSLGGQIFVRSEYGRFCEFTVVVERGGNERKAH